jgi:hypothetical protein
MLFNANRSVVPALLATGLLVALFHQAPTEVVGVPSLLNDLQGLSPKISLQNRVRPSGPRPVSAGQTKNVRLITEARSRRCLESGG